MFTDRQCELIQISWKLVTEGKGPGGAMKYLNFTELFYEIVFDLAPDVKILFQNDMVLQGEALVAMLKVVVKNVRTLGDVIKPVEELGLRHKSYGVKPNMYLVVGRSLIIAFGQLAGDAMTHEIKWAWMQVYATLAEVMIKVSGGHLKKNTILGLIDPDYFDQNIFRYIVGNKNITKTFNAEISKAGTSPHHYKTAVDHVDQGENTDNEDYNNNETDNETDNESAASTPGPGVIRSISTMLRNNDNRRSKKLSRSNSDNSAFTVQPTMARSQDALPMSTLSTRSIEARSSDDLCQETPTNDIKKGFVARKFELLRRSLRKSHNQDDNNMNSDDRFESIKNRKIGIVQEETSMENEGGVQVVSGYPTTITSSRDQKTKENNKSMSNSFNKLPAPHTTSVPLNAVEVS